MNTPTPEQLQDFKEWFCKYVKSKLSESQDVTDEELIGKVELDKSFAMFNAYYEHRIATDPGFQSNAELKRKLAALQEKVHYWVEHWNLRDVEATKLQQQLTDARKEIEGLKERMTRARSILTKDNPTSTNNWAMLDVSDNTPTA